MDTISVITRVIAILCGFFVAFFSYGIYNYSKGGLRSWIYISAYGFSLFLWAFTALVLRILGNDTLTWLSGIIFLSAMAVLIPLSYSKLSEELKTSSPSWMNPRTAIIVVIFAFMLTLLISTFSPSLGGNPLARILSVSLFGLGLSLIFALLPLGYVVLHTKRLPWILSFVGFFIISFSLVTGQHYNGCCFPGGEMHEDLLCEGYSLDYTEISPLPCSSFLVLLGRSYQFFLMLGFVSITGSFYLMWRLFRQFEN